MAAPRAAISASTFSSPLAISWFAIVTASPISRRTLVARANGGASLGASPAVEKPGDQNAALFLEAMIASRISGTSCIGQFRPRKTG